MTVRNLWDCDCQGAVGLGLSGSCGTVTVRELWDRDCQGAVGLQGSVGP